MLHPPFRPRRLAYPHGVLVVALLACACAGPGDELDDELEPRIVGGTIAPDDAWPWAAALVAPGGTVGPAFCGGALIDSRHILTAKHCVDGLAPSDVSVALDREQLDATGTGIRSKVIAIHLDPDHDIAVLRLIKTIDTLEPIPIAGSDTLWPGDPLTTIGWGTTSSGGALSNELRQVDVRAIAHTECNASDSYDGDVAGDEICAGSMSGGVDSCQGDSGGPLMQRTADGWHVVGVTSWGIGCAAPDFPGIYASTAAARSFLEGFEPTLEPPTLSGFATAQLMTVL